MASVVGWAISSLNDGMKCGTDCLSVCSANSMFCVKVKENNRRLVSAMAFPKDLTTGKVKENNQRFVSATAFPKDLTTLSVHV